MPAAVTRYALNDGFNIAYQSFGTGPPNVMCVAGWLSHLDLVAEHTGYNRFVERLASFSRLVVFDKRGVGLSDRVSPGLMPSLEERIDDVRAVMDAAGAQSVHLMAIHEAGPMCILFAATHPELVDSLVLYGSWAAGTSDDDYPWAPSPDDHARLQEAITRRWGRGIGAANLAPSERDDPWFRDWLGRYERAGATPGAASALATAMAATDVRDLLGTLRVPTLVLHRATDRMVDPGNGRYLAEHIPGAQHVELPTGDHWVGHEPDQLVDEIERFITGRRSTDANDRILSTVLFTDVERSTELAVELGDRRWRALLDEHDGIASHLVVEHRGRLLKTTGDGLVATFDGPARAVRCALELVAQLGVRAGLRVRAGVHTGEIERRGDDIAGIGVNIAARVSSAASAGEVLVSRTVVDLVAGSGLGFSERGDHTLKGVPGTWRLFAAG